MDLDVSQRIYIAGHNGMVGNAILRRLRELGFENLVLKDRSELDVRDTPAVDALFSQTKPDVVIVGAAKVGGIAANMTSPADFLVDNLQIQNNLLLAALEHQVKMTVLLGSSCVYPREAPQPIPEDALLTGPLEPTNEGYAIAKIAGIKLAQALAKQHGLHVLCPMPCNLYGPGDHFEFERSHVVSALVRRFVEAARAAAPSIELWGTGQARRELMHVDDLSEAVLFLLENFDSSELINVGTGIDHTIEVLAHMIAGKVGYDGDIRWDPTKPDGTPRKLLDVGKIHSLGWRHRIELEEGLDSMIDEFERRYPAR